MRGSVPALIVLVGCAGFLSNAWAADLGIVAEPYIRSGLYTRPLLPAEGTPVAIGVEAQVTGELDGPVTGAIEIAGPEGDVVHRARLPLGVDGAVAAGEIQWAAGRNGLYRIRVQLDPDNALVENSEANNSAELVKVLFIQSFGKSFEDKESN